MEFMCAVRIANLTKQRHIKTPDDLLKPKKYDPVVFDIMGFRGSDLLKSQLHASSRRLPSQPMP